ncbi:MAG TPA: serine hydrolase, partial [Candidatus Acidoferrales bacterium]|nr:serine hydrolase [Candidatus Acidoferrales bacterium]
MRFKTLLALLAITLAPALARADSGCGAPAAGPDNWPVATPESVGLSSAALCPVAKWLDDNKQNNVHAVVVARHGKLVFERYFTGADEHLGRPAGEVKFNAETRHDERSVSKSVTGLVMGIAIDRGWIKSVDAPVLSFFPEYKNLATPDKNRITLRDLLTMSSGLEWHEFMVPYTSKENSEIAMDTSPDPYRFALSQPIATMPGKIWNYNSGSTELLGAVLHKATGKPLDELARTQLFEPLGIADVEWYKYAAGNPSAAAGLRLRPRDLAKIGQLVLQRGIWNGKQIVSSKWIETSTSPQIGAIELNFYGYQFWLGRSLVNRREVLGASAVGLGGQRVFIVPEFELVVVVNAGLYQSPLQGMVPLTILNQYVL